MKDNKNMSYVESVHRMGKIWFFVAYLFMFALPIVTSIYFDAWPTWKQFFGAAVGIVPIYWTVGIVEAFTYMPMLGAGGTYLGFITGNMSNLKVPVALNAMNSVDAKQGSEEGEVISTIAIAVSSIVTVVIITIFVILTVPLEPIFSSPVLTPAFNNLVPALFGGLMVAYIGNDPKVSIPTFAIGIALFVAIPSLAGVYPLILPLLALFAILLARFLYKRGKI